MKKQESKKENLEFSDSQRRPEPLFVDPFDPKAMFPQLAEMAQAEGQPKTNAPIKGILEPDEKLIYSEKSEPFKNAGMSFFWIFFAIVSFPFFSIIGFVGIAGLAQGKDVAMLASDLAFPAGIILMELVGLGIVVPIISKKLSIFMPNEQKLIITNKRIFYEGGIAKMMSPSVAMAESRFSETLCVSTEQTGDLSILKFKIRKENPGEDETAEQTHLYNVSNAKLIYSYLPADLTLSKGELSFDGSREIAREQKTTFALRVFMLLFVVAVGAISAFLYLEETTSAHLKEGKRAMRHSHFNAAEAEFEKAYAGISLIPFHSYYGPSCYRLASCYVRNKKPDKAIPLFLKAIENCNHESSDTMTTWKPAVFRSYAKLGSIYAAKGDNATAVSYFDKAMASMDMEADSTWAWQIGKEYANLLNKMGDTKKAEAVDKVSSNFVANSRYKAFSESHK